MIPATCDALASDLRKHGHRPQNTIAGARSAVIITTPRRPNLFDSRAQARPDLVADHLHTAEPRGSGPQCSAELRVGAGAEEVRELGRRRHGAPCAGRGQRPDAGALDEPLAQRGMREGGCAGARAGERGAASAMAASCSPALLNPEGRSRISQAGTRYNT